MKRWESSCTAFEGDRRIASGSLMDVACAVKAVADQEDHAPILVFDDRTSHPVELDLRGSMSDVAERYAPIGLTRVLEPEAGGITPEPRRGPGRPRLGVVGREVTLLPRHWSWLGAQRGGASATLRRLVEQARKASTDTDRIRALQGATYAFMVAMVGNHPGFEEATRALYARDGEGFHAESEGWPPDLRDHARRLAKDVFTATTAPDPTL